MSSSPTDPQFTGTVRFRRESSRATVSAEIMVAAIVFFVMTVAFVVFLYLYARWRWGPGSSERRARERRMRRGHHHGDRARGRRLPKGLDAAVLEALPVKVYKREEFAEDGGVECAVCLMEVADGEKVRMLPKCNHGFHVECIDMWFASHTTCPLCRDPVGKQHAEERPEDDEELEDEDTTTTTEATTATDTEDQHPTEPPPNFPTNVLFWGTQDRVSTAAPAATQEPEPAVVPPPSVPGTSGPGKPEGALVIDIPARVVVEEFSSSSSSPSSIRSGWAATPTRLRSFRRLFSREKRVAAAPGCSCEGGAGDIEQGCSGVDGFVIPTTTPKTPPSLVRVSTPKTPTQAGL